jgi:hypothetical protein
MEDEKFSRLYGILLVSIFLIGRADEISKMNKKYVNNTDGLTINQ